MRDPTVVRGKNKNLPLDYDYTKMIVLTTKMFNYVAIQCYYFTVVSFYENIQVFVANKGEDTLCCNSG